LWAVYGRSVHMQASFTLGRIPQAAHRCAANTGSVVLTWKGLRRQARKRTAYEAKQLAEKAQREAEEAQRAAAVEQQALHEAAEAEARGEAGATRVADVRSADAIAEVQALRQQSTAAFPLVLELPALQRSSGDDPYEEGRPTKDGNEVVRAVAAEGDARDAEDGDEGQVFQRLPPTHLRRH
jgi:hypothetical protein